MEPGERLPESLHGQYSVLIGMGFSLWRAAFLADISDDASEDALKDAAQLANKLLTDNTISFQQDRATRSWMFGYYLNSARDRMRRLSHFWKSTNSAIELPLIHGNAIQKWGQAADGFEMLVRALQNAAAPTS